MFCIFQSLLFFFCYQQDLREYNIFISLYSYACGGVMMYIETPNYHSSTIDCCVFTQCKAGFGGALFLSTPPPPLHAQASRITVIIIIELVVVIMTKHLLFVKHFLL
jgi:hypothetical protein